MIAGCCDGKFDCWNPNNLLPGVGTNIQPAGTSGKLFSNATKLVLPPVLPEDKSGGGTFGAAMATVATVATGATGAAKATGSAGGGAAGGNIGGGPAGSQGTNSIRALSTFGLSGGL